MKSYKELSIAELKELQGELNKEYEEAKETEYGKRSSQCRAA